VIPDPTAPGGYRIEGTLRLPISLEPPTAETQTADQAVRPDRRLRNMVAGEGYDRVETLVADLPPRDTPKGS
jgi:hypothetical protein